MTLRVGQDCGGEDEEYGLMEYMEEISSRRMEYENVDFGCFGDVLRQFAWGGEVCGHNAGGGTVSGRDGWGG